MWTNYLCLYWCIHMFSWIQVVKFKCIINHWRQGIVTLTASPSLVAHCVVILTTWDATDAVRFSVWRTFCFSLIAIQYPINSSYQSPRDGGSWWVQTIRWIMLNTFVVTYCANVRPIKISSVRFCFMDIDITLGPHKFSQQANKDYQWTLHIFQPLYYICQLFPWAFMTGLLSIKWRIPLTSQWHI